MYIDYIEIQNFRTFRKTQIQFSHADQDFKKLGIPRPRLPNLNLLLADNGYGKTSLLKAIALAALGPAVTQAGIFPYRLVRREAGLNELKKAVLKAGFTTHEQDHWSVNPNESDKADISIHKQDRSSVKHIESIVEIIPKGDLELLECKILDLAPWEPIFDMKIDAFFMVGYGATRRVAKSTRIEQSGKYSLRAARIMGLFEEDYSLRPLNAWLPKYKDNNQLRGRYVQVEHLLDRLVFKGGWKFTGKQDNDDEYMYGNKGVLVPFPALSDGYRAFLGWLGDLIYHVCETCPSGKKLAENKGIVMVDEIDLHLHPKWQMIVLQSLAKALPNLQFIVTSHSPLIVGSLEWMNIIAMSPGPKLSSQASRIQWPVHGLDADQVLLTDFFGLKSTRAPGKKRTLKELSLKARHGDTEAAKKILEEMSRGMEEAR